MITTTATYTLWLCVTDTHLDEEERQADWITWFGSTGGRDLAVRTGAHVGSGAEAVSAGAATNSWGGKKNNDWDIYWLLDFHRWVIFWVFYTSPVLLFLIYTLECLNSSHKIKVCRFRSGPAPGLSVRQTCSSSRHMPAVLFRKYRLNRINAIARRTYNWNASKRCLLPECSC